MERLTVCNLYQVNEKPLPNVFRNGKALGSY